MNINKYLKKLNINFEFDNKTNIFTFMFENQEVKLNKKEIEQHLFWSLVDLIKKK